MRALAHEHVDLALALLQQPLDQAAPDEAGRSCHEVGHRSSSLSRIGRACRARRYAPAPAPAPPRPSPAAKRAAPARAVLEHLRARPAPPARAPRASGMPEPLDRRAAVGEHRALGEPREALGERERALEVRARRDDLGEQAHRQRLARRRSCARSGSGRARGRARRCAAGAGCRRRSAARPSGARDSRASSPRWRSAGRTTAPARGRPPGRSPRSPRSSAWTASAA